MTSDMKNARHLANCERIEKLRKQGYRFEITSDGYSVWFGEIFLGSSSEKLARQKKIRYRYFTEQALLVADQKRFPFFDLTSARKSVGLSYGI